MTSHTPAPPPPSGTKRSFEFFDPWDGAEGSDEEVFDGEPIDKTCNQVRGQIRRFLDNGGMKVGEFCDAIFVTNKSLNDFLRKTGSMDGSGSNTYRHAWIFFKKRERDGIKMPAKKKAKTTASNTASSQQTAKTPTTDISTVHLDGEDTKQVKVYDSCDEIRKKINRHLRNTAVSQAQFCRDLAAQLPGDTKIQSKQLTDFRTKKGASAGNTSCVFYAAYVYFEKLRIAGDKCKSKHRLDMEKAWPAGFDTLHGSHNTWVFSAGPPKTLYEDDLGRTTLR